MAIDPSILADGVGNGVDLGPFRFPGSGLLVIAGNFDNGSVKLQVEDHDGNRVTLNNGTFTEDYADTINFAGDTPFYVVTENGGGSMNINLEIH